VVEGSIPTVFTYKWKGQELVELLEQGKTLFLSLEEGSHCSFQVRFTAKPTIVNLKRKSHEIFDCP
jgi:hypothetical protein